MSPRASAGADERPEPVPTSPPPEPSLYEKDTDIEGEEEASAFGTTCPLAIGAPAVRGRKAEWQRLESLRPGRLTLAWARHWRP